MHARAPGSSTCLPEPSFTLTVLGDTRGGGQRFETRHVAGLRPKDPAGIITGANLGCPPPSTAYAELAGETRKGSGSPSSEEGTSPWAVSSVNQNQRPMPFFGS